MSFFTKNIEGKSLSDKVREVMSIPDDKGELPNFVYIENGEPIALYNAIFNAESERTDLWNEKEEGIGI